MTAAAAIAVDGWGHDPDYARRVAPVLDELYARRWRMHAGGESRVPAAGPALVLAEAGNDDPWIALMAATALRHAIDRDARFLVAPRQLELPGVAVALRRLGGVAATAANARRLLGEGRVVLAFGALGSRLRAGAPRPAALAIAALRAGAPIVPCAVAERGPRLPVAGTAGAAACCRLTFCAPLHAGRETTADGVVRAARAAIARELTSRDTSAEGAI